MLGLMSRKSCDMVNAANEPRIDRHKSGADDSEIAWAGIIVGTLLADLAGNPIRPAVAARWVIARRAFGRRRHAAQNSATALFQLWFFELR
jgi:hypothetical protein